MLKRSCRRSGFATKEHRERKRGDRRARNLPARKFRSPLPKGEGQGEGKGNVKPAQRPSHLRDCTAGRRKRPRIPHASADAQSSGATAPKLPSEGGKNAKEKTGTEGLGPLIPEKTSFRAAFFRSLPANLCVLCALCVRTPFPQNAKGGGRFNREWTRMDAKSESDGRDGALRCPRPQAQSGLCLRTANGGSGLTAKEHSVAEPKPKRQRIAPTYFDSWPSPACSKQGVEGAFPWCQGPMHRQLSISTVGRYSPSHLRMANYHHFRSSLRSARYKCILRVRRRYLAQQIGLCIPVNEQPEHEPLPLKTTRNVHSPFRIHRSFTCRGGNVRMSRAGQLWPSLLQTKF